MSKLRFLVADVRDSSPQEWLRVWARKYSPDDDDEYRDLIKRFKSFSAADFERIGKWKDGVRTDLQWRPNVASVAYLIWKEAAQELPKCPEQGEAKAFLDYWAGKEYTDEYKNGSRMGCDLLLLCVSESTRSFTQSGLHPPRMRHFGPPRATTLLHFVSGGRFPIFDRRVRTAVARLNSTRLPPNTVAWYLDSYCKLFSELAVLCECEADDSRLLDKALFSYGSSEELNLSDKLVFSRT